MITIASRTLLAKSCKRCGLLKQAKDFGGVVTKGVFYYSSHCYECKNEMGRPTVLAHQRVASSVAVRHKQPWSDRDIDLLREMVSDGLTGAQMALALNRTVYSVYTMKNKLDRESK